MHQSRPADPSKLKPVPWFLEYVNKDVTVISREALYKALQNGTLPSYRFGKKWLIDPEEILAALRGHCSGTR